MTRSPLTFFGTIDDEAVAALIRDIEARAPHEDLVEVVFCGAGGYLSSAFVFMNWMHGYAWRSRVRVVAAAEMATTAVLMFLAFERRTADAMASVSLAMPESQDPADRAPGSWNVVKGILAYSVITRTLLSLADARLRIESGEPLTGEELWSSGFCNEGPTGIDGAMECAEAGGDPTQDSDDRPPILFMDEVTFKSVDALVGELVARGDGGGTVVIATKGGKLAAAQGFWSWMRRFPARRRFLAVAGGLVASAGVTLFGSFERRTADPWATVVFHDVIFERHPDDPRLKAYAAVMQGLLHAWFRTRFDAGDRLLELLADSRVALTGIGLRKVKILTEEPREPAVAVTDGAGPLGPRADAGPEEAGVATVSFAGTPDLAAVRALTASLTELASTHAAVRVEFSSRGCVEGASVVDYLVYLGLASWMRRFPWAERVAAVATGPIDVPTVALFLAFDVRSVAASGSLCLNASVDGAPPLDLRLALGEEASYEAKADAAVRSYSVWAFMALLLDRTRVTSELALAWSADRSVIAGAEAERLGFASP